MSHTVVQHTILEFQQIYGCGSYINYGRCQNLIHTLSCQSQYDALYALVHTSFTFKQIRHSTAALGTAPPGNTHRVKPTEYICISINVLYKQVSLTQEQTVILAQIRQMFIT